MKKMNLKDELNKANAIISLHIDRAQGLHRVQVEGTPTAVMAGLCTIIQAIEQRTGIPTQMIVSTISDAMKDYRDHKANLKTDMEKQLEEIEEMAKMMGIPQSILDEVKKSIGLDVTKPMTGSAEIEVTGKKKEVS
jgi:hypothetical protein